jgi:enterochelin esterase family protein
MENPDQWPMPASPAIAALRRELESDRGAIDRFLSAHEFPLAEPPLYTFVYRGRAEAVRLRHWVHGLPASQPFERLGSSDLWVRTLELPDDSRVEYKFEIVRDGGSHWEEDALNPNRARDPFGANSVVAARGYVVPEWALEDPDVPRGEFDELLIESAAFGEPRRVGVYRPAGYRESRRYPLLVVHDGDDYLEYASLRAVLDNLIYRLELPGLIVALLHPERRLNEYAADERHPRFVVDELLPRLEGAYPLIELPESRGLMGASLGAVAALQCALARPSVFGRLLLQSGSFAFTDIGENQRGPVFEPIVAMVNAFRAAPTRPADRIFVSVGRYESLVAENRALVPVLRSTGADVRFVEVRDGHNWENWRDRLRVGLSWLFPGPLWMVYE